MPPTIHETGTARATHEALRRINWQSLLQLSHAADCFRCDVGAPHHDITIPRPDETVRFDKPNACNQCHVDWSVNRAIAATQRLWPKAFANSQLGDKQFDEPEDRRALFAGDAVMRTLTVAAMTPANDVTAPLLLEAMHDRYPIVRYFAANALAAHFPLLPKPDYLAPAETRDATLHSWYPRFTPDALRLAKEARERLSAGRTEADVEVGE